ncbi:MAG: F0F1 ATP synthase subunit gamma [Deltaproteobacteria bacterium]
MKVISQIKKDLEFNRSLHSLVEVLKSVAVSHYRMLEKSMKSEEQFYAVLRAFFQFPFFRVMEHPFLSGADAPAGIVAVTSDMGLLGGLNMKVMAAALEATQKGAYRLMVIGERGHAFAREAGFSFVAFPGVKDEERYGQALALRDYLTEQLAAGKIGSLAVFYPEPVSFLVQRIKKMTLVPFGIPGADEPVEEKFIQETILESKTSDIIEYLISLWIGQAFYEILGFSRLAELSARFVHLEGSAQKIKEVEKKMQLVYFRVRHELIDKSMREIFSARSLYAAS